MNLDVVDRVGRVADAISNLDGPATRRTLLGAALGVAFAQAQDFESFAISDPSTSYKSTLLRLLRRITYGLTETGVARAKSMGFSKYLEYQLNPAGIDDSSCDAFISANYPRLPLDSISLSQFDDDWVSSEQLVEATIARRILSSRQLYEKMVEFWSDHFNISIEKVGGWLKLPDDKNVIRAHALDTFPNLLYASAASPAMLIYLDNAESYGDHPNQNYAREVMELHTLGVNGGYTQTDIEQLALCLTGWMIEWDDQSPNYGGFVFADWAHAGGNKQFLGHTIPDGGVNEGIAALQILAHHPSTAKFIATKLCKYFLGYSPPASTIDHVATVYKNTGGDIKSMLRAILTTSHLSAAKAKHKRPIHFAAAAIRSLHGTILGTDGLRWGFLGQAGHVPFEWGPPNGYPDVPAYWTGYIIPRWDFALDLASDNAYNLHIDPVGLVGSATTPTAIANRIDTLLYGGEMLAADKTDLVKFLKAQPIDEWRIREAFALTLASASFQWY